MCYETSPFPVLQALQHTAQYDEIDRILVQADFKMQQKAEVVHQDCMNTMKQDHPQNTHPIAPLGAGTATGNECANDMDASASIWTPTDPRQALLAASWLTDILTQTLLQACKSMHM